MSSTVFTYSDNTTSTSSNTTLSSSSYTIPSGQTLVSVAIGTAVTSIASGCFQNRSSITSVTFNSGSTCTTIGSNAFRGCSGLTTITFPSSLTTINDTAFYQSGLTTLTIPSNITTLGNDCFSNMAITSVFVPSSINNSTGINIFSANSLLTSIEFQNGLTNIYIGFCSDCPQLSIVIIPNSVLYINGRSFANCTSLASITLPPNLISIGITAFNGCSALSSITLPSSLTTIGTNGFGGCTSLTSLSIPPALATYTSAFSGCTSLTSVVFQSGCQSISQDAFLNCTSLTFSGLVIPNTLTTIGGFRGCTAMTTVNIPASVQIIGTRAFFGCSNLSTLTLPNGLITLGTEAFRNCGALSSVAIPTTLVTIDDNCFDGCSLINSFILSPVINKLGTGAFANTGVISISIPASIVDIGTYLFYGCLSLTSIAFVNTANVVSGGTDHFLQTTQPIQVRFLAASSYSGLNAASKAMVTSMLSAGNVSVFYGPPCFLKGTKILAMVDYVETWVPVEDLRKGHYVKTVDGGFVPIDIIGYKEIENPADYERTQNRLYIYRKEVHPTLNEDLIITGMHSVLVRSVNPELKAKIEAVFDGNLYYTQGYYRLPACVDERCQPYVVGGTHIIYHFALDNTDYYKNYGVYANGLLVESSSKRYMHEIANMEPSV